MKIGYMNNPSKDVIKEIEWASKNGFDFMDLTLEMKAAPDKINIKKVKQALNKYNIGVIGHTGWWIPHSDSYKELRQASFKIFKDCLNIFSKLGVKYMNVHPHPSQGFLLGHDKVLKYNIELLKKLVREGKKRSIKVMLENSEPLLSTEDTIKIIENVPGLKFHLDIGHANLAVEKIKVKDYLKKLSKKLVHVHVHDNMGGMEDLHLPMGAGRINWKEIIRLLKKYKYDSTITTEIHSQDRDYILVAQEKLRKWWSEC